MRALARALDAVLDGAMWLVLPLSALLFAQWPLRARSDESGFPSRLEEQ